MQGKPEPCLIAIIGASGDLARRKLLPALFDLFRAGLMPERFAIAGIARSKQDDAAFRETISASIERFARGGPDEAGRRDFLSRLHYVELAAIDADSFRAIEPKLADLEKSCGLSGNRLFYLSTPPDGAFPTAQALSQAGILAQAGGWRRVVFEKPFGRSLESAQELNRDLRELMEERQVFRIDHYLGKETVQNLLALRFANSIFEPLWNARHVSHVQITVAESIGVESRGAYFDHAGILRDMVQNHMLQALSLIAMEPPSSLAPDAIRDEKTKLLRSIRKSCACDFLGKNVVRAQYVAGQAGGQPAKAYLEEQGIASQSRTETFAALRFWIDNWRWEGVPFYLRVGKRLPARATVASIHFRHPPRTLFNADAGLSDNALVVNIQPNPGIALRFNAKSPDLRHGSPKVEQVALNFNFADAFACCAPPPDAYERLLLDVMQGDATLFLRADEIEAAWEVASSILERWDSCHSTPLATYPAGTWGPAEAEELIRQDGFAWDNPA